MSNTNFPGAIDTPTNPTGSNTLNSPDHALQHGLENDAIVALETKVGINSSADTTSMDYKLSGVPASDKAASKTGTENLTNKTLGTGTTVSLGSDAQGDLYTRSNGGALQRVPVGSAGQVLGVSAGLPAFVPNPAASNGSTSVAGVFQKATTADITAGTTTGSTGALLVVGADAVGSAGASKLVQYDASGKLPAVDGSQLTNLPPNLRMKLSSSFETAGRFTVTNVTTGASTFTTLGLQQTTGASGTSSTSADYQTAGGSTPSLFAAGGIFSAMMNINTLGTTGSYYIGIGRPTVAGTGHTFTVAHIGFKVIISGSVATLSATVADGTEVATVLGSLASGDTVDLILQIVSTSSVNFYWRKNGGALSAAINIATHIPTAAEQYLRISIANDSTATTNLFTASGMDFER